MKFEVEVWNEVWSWSLKLKFEDSVLSWSLKLKKLEEGMNGTLGFTILKFQIGILRIVCIFTTVVRGID